MRKSKQFLGIVLLILVLLVGVSCSTLSSQEDTTDTTLGITSENSLESNEGELVSEYIANISSDNMIKTITFLSSKDNARVTGFEGESAAADYITEHFKNLGLEATEESFPVKAYAPLSLSLQVVSEENRVIEEAKALSYSLGTDEAGLTAEVVNVGLGADEDYKDLDVTGKMVLISRGGEYFYIKTDRAAQKGAIGAIFYDPTSEGAISATLTRLSKIPAVSIAPKTAQSLIDSINSDKGLTVNLKLDIIHKDATSKNIISVYPSTNNPDGKIVIVGAHYDGVDTPAANDNASGTSVILEIARILKEQKVELPFDVKFIAFGAEEIGLVGSNYYANHMDIDEKNATIAMLNFDMVGVGDTFEISMAGGENASKLIGLARNALKEMGLSLDVSQKENSDHSSFSYVGIPAILIEAGPFKDYHTDKDTVEGIEPAVLSNSCELGIKLLVEELTKQFN